MIEIITHHVDMPPFSQRRFKKDSSLDGKKWTVIDTGTGQIVKRGCFEDVALACHNLNKKFYDTKS